MSNRIEDRARKAAEPFLTENGCVLWDVVFEKEGAMQYLRILFDGADETLTSDKCEKLTPPLNKIMDAQDFIGQVDILEIGSPGITRRLRSDEHFTRSVGKRLKAAYRDESGRPQTAEGILAEYDAEKKAFTVQSGDTAVEIALKKCSRVNLSPDPAEFAE